MRILYGVVGEGMGHATRSRVVLEHLLTRGHDVHVVVSGKAHGFLKAALAGGPRAAVTEIAGLRLVQDDGGVDKSASLVANLVDAPASLVKNLGAYVEVASSFRPDAVVSDFESFAYLFARTHDLPVISLDNIQVLNRCAHDRWLTDASRWSVFLAKASAKVKMPGAWHYLVTSFFFPPVRKARTTLIPPILRPEILAARREPGEHVLVYQHAEAVEALLPALRARTDVAFRVYGSRREGSDGNLSFQAFSQQGFIDDLRTARGVVAGGGFTLMSEAVHLGVPMLSVPLGSQAEQAFNAAYLEHLGYGVEAPSLDAAALDGFLGRLPALTERLASYPRQDNRMAMGCLDELLAGLASGEPRPEFLRHASMGDRFDAETIRRTGG